jgi:UDP-N-acetylmuramoylalanine--D-glutamate ligase
VKIAIIGYGLEGKAAYEYWKDQGSITVCDVNPIDVPSGVQVQFGSDYLKGLSSFDLIVRSPVIKPREIAEANGGDEILERVTSNTNEFIRVCPSQKIIGVTGTKGKGTTTTLIAKMLEAMGEKVFLGGNIGVPALDLLKQNISGNDWVVLELSSFQLIDFHYSPRIAVCLMVVPEHQDWHLDVEEYYSAKSSLFARQNPEDIAIYCALNSNSKQIASVSKGHKIPYLEPPGAVVVDDAFISIDNLKLCSVSELGLRGKHNWQNVCAAITAVWQVSKNPEAIKSVLIGFTGLEHRLEHVADINGVGYYDDSFGTTPETAMVAIEAFSEPEIVILGGSDKGASYDELAKTVSENNVATVLLIGNQGPAIESALRNRGYTNMVHGGSSMQEIVRQAQSLAKPGYVVVLSPACASFDMFKNYKDRGNQFKQAVRELVSDGAQ